MVRAGVLISALLCAVVFSQTTTPASSRVPDLGNVLKRTFEDLNKITSPSLQKSRKSRAELVKANTDAVEGILAEIKSLDGLLDFQITSFKNEPDGTVTIVGAFEIEMSAEVDAATRAEVERIEKESRKEIESLRSFDPKRIPGVIERTKQTTGKLLRDARPRAICVAELSAAPADVAGWRAGQWRKPRVQIRQDSISYGDGIDSEFYAIRRDRNIRVRFVGKIGEPPVELAAEALSVAPAAPTTEPTVESLSAELKELRERYATLLDTYAELKVRHGTDVKAAFEDGAAAQKAFTERAKQQASVEADRARTRDLPAVGRSSKLNDLVHVPKNAVVFQVVEKAAALIKVNGEAFMVVGIDTTGMVDGRNADLPGKFRIVDTYTYENAIGSTSTVFVLRPE